MLVSFILAVNVFEFLFITLPYVLGFLYLVFQLLGLYFHILHIVYLSRIRCSNIKRSCKWVSDSMISFIKLQCQSIDQWHAAVGLFGARRYAAIIKKSDLEIFKFKSFNYPSVFLQHYNFSTFGPAW